MDDQEFRERVVGCLEGIGTTLGSVEVILTNMASAALPPSATASSTKDSRSDADHPDTPDDWQRTPVAEKWWGNLDFWDKVAAKRAYEQAIASTTAPTPPSSSSTPSEAESGRVEQNSECAHEAPLSPAAAVYRQQDYTRCSKCGVSLRLGWILVPAAATTSSTSRKQESQSSAAESATGSPASSSPTFPRIVSHVRAAEAAQRLINSHFRQDPHARASIPVEPDDDDITIMDYIAQQAAPVSSESAPDRPWGESMSR